MFYLISGVVFGFVGVCIWYSLTSAIGVRFFKWKCIQMFAMFAVIGAIGSFGGVKLYQFQHPYEYETHTYNYQLAEMPSGYIVSTDGKRAHFLVKNNVLKNIVHAKSVPQNAVSYKKGTTPTVEIHTQEPHKASASDKFWFLHKDETGPIVYNDVIITIASDPTV